MLIVANLQIEAVVWCGQANSKGGLAEALPTPLCFAYAGTEYV